MYAPVLVQETSPFRRERGNAVLHLGGVTSPIIHRVWLRVTNRQSSGNTVGSLRKRGEKARSREEQGDKREREERRNLGKGRGGTKGALEREREEEIERG